MAPSALLDTCVIYPNYLRDTLLRLAASRLYRPLWSTDILAELRRNLVKRGIPESGVERLIAAMNGNFVDAEVTGYHDLIPAMACDPKDRHVLAAAVHARADSLVTFNIRDFPAESLAPYPVNLLTPDDFLLDLLDLIPRAVIRIVCEQAAGHKREPRTLAGLLTVLSQGGAARFADEVRRLIG